MPELELGEREDDAGKKPEEVQGGEGGGGGGGGESGGGGGGNSTQDDKGATQPTRELPELVPGAHDASNKDGKKPHCRVSEKCSSRAYFLLWGNEKGSCTILTEDIPLCVIMLQVIQSTKLFVIINTVFVFIITACFNHHPFYILSLDDDCLGLQHLATVKTNIFLS